MSLTTIENKPERGFHHITVMLNETVDSLGSIDGKTVVDCTLGGGGHTRLLLEKVGASGKVVAFDRDIDALAHAKSSFSSELASGRLELIDAPFSSLKTELTKRGLLGMVSGIIADIGVSSHQIDQALRGFSFSSNGPLDMRMNARSGQSAADFLNSAAEDEIANVIYHYGEEHKSRQIARLIVKQRSVKPLITTFDLAELIARARLWKEKSKKHPATKTFQALRIFINDELDELKTLCHDGLECLASGGRMAIISFHSLEDRIVKEAFLDFTGKTKLQSVPRHLPMTESELHKLVNKRGVIVGDFPAEPSASEIQSNPRARSAKLRTIEKISTSD